MGSKLYGFIAFFLLFSTMPAYAFYPVDGWWFNPSESGRGINIEMQDDTMFVAFFHYNEDGSQAWWVTSGTYDHSQARFQSDFIALADGQCPGCPFVSPEIVPLADSQVIINFDSATSATMTWAGGTTELFRQYFSQFDLSDLRTFMLGEFHFTQGELGIYFGEWLIIDELLNSDSGPVFVGYRRDNPSRILVGRFSSSLQEFTLLIDSSTSFYTFFAFDMTKDRIEGRSWTYEKGDNLSGPGLTLIGHRSASRSYVQTGVGPNSVLNSSALYPGSTDEIRERIDSVLHELQIQQFRNQTNVSERENTISSQSKELEALLSQISPSLEH